MTVKRVLVVLVLLSSLGSMLLGAAASVSPVHQALTFILVKMMNAQGGIHTQYQALVTPQEELAAGHDVLLQNSSLLMHYATGSGDQQLFDQQVKLIKNCFLAEPVGLLYWKLNTHMRPMQSSWGTYSNDPGESLRLVEALLSAYDLWGEEFYWDLAFRIGDGLKTHNLAPDKTLRYYAAWKPDFSLVEYGDRVVLAQLNFAGMRGLAWWDRSWEAPLAANLEIVLTGTTDQGLFYQNYLPAEQRYEKGDGSMLHMAQIAYQLAVYGHSDPDSAALDTAQAFLGFVKEEYARNGKILGRYDPETGTPLVAWENTAVYALTAQTALRLGDASFAGAIVSEKLIPSQQTARQSPVYGAFSATTNDAYAFDTLETLLALQESGASSEDEDHSPIRAVWYLGWHKESYQQSGVINDLWQIQSRLCSNYIGLFASTYQDDVTSSNPHRDPERTASDEALRNVILQIHRMGMGVILLTPLFPDDESWEGEIRPNNVELWFDHWREILLHYATLAEETHVEVLLLGSELATLRNRKDDWNRLIVAVKSIYHGKLGYSVNFWADRVEYQQVKEMTQWRHLDYIGVTGYFELTDEADPSIEDLKVAWNCDRKGQDILADLEALHHEYGKPIVFWEIGYTSKDGTNIYPWDFPRPGEEDLGEQADCWEAFLSVFSGIEWFQGYGIYAERIGLPKIHKMYGVLGKPAEDVFGNICGD